MRNSGGVDTSQMLRGALDLVVLAVLADEDGYGYDVLRRLRDAGLAEVGDASVYGTLRRLSKSGLLLSYTAPSAEGPDRRYYGPTPAGRAELALAEDLVHDAFLRLHRAATPPAPGAGGS